MTIISTTIVLTVRLYQCVMMSVHIHRTKLRINALIMLLLFIAHECTHGHRRRVRREDVIKRGTYVSIF